MSVIIDALNDLVKNNVNEAFPNLNKYLARINTDLLSFTSALSKRTRPVIRMSFEYTDQWKRAKEFEEFMANQVRTQLPSGYKY